MSLGSTGGTTGDGRVPAGGVGVDRTRSRYAATDARAPGWSPADAEQRTRTAWSDRSRPLWPARVRRRALRAWPREDEFLQSGFLGPDRHRLLAEDLDHGRDRVGVVADLVEDHRAAVLHEPAGVARLLHRVDDRVGIIERRRALEDVGDEERGVVRVARVRVEGLAARALAELLGDGGGLGVLEVRPRHARQHVLEVFLELGELTGLVDPGAAGPDDAHHVDPLLADLGEQQERRGGARDRRDDVRLGRLGLRDLRREVRRRLGPRNDLDDVPRRVGGLVRRLKAAGLVLAEEIVAVHQDDPLGRHAGFLEDVDEVLDGPPAEARAGGEVAVDVLDLLLAVLDRPRDVRRDRIGGGDVDEERHAPLLGHRYHRVGAARVEGAQQHLGALAHDALGLDAAVLGLGLGVADDQLELDPVLSLDTAGGVDRVDGHLCAEAAGLSRLGEGAGDRMDRADLERLGLRAERKRKPEGRGAAGGGREERTTGQSTLHAKPPLFTARTASSTQELFGDDHPLDLVRALVDLHDLRVAHVPLHRELPRIAVPAEDLHRVGGDLHRGVAGPALGHRRFVRVAPDAGVDLARGVVNHQPRGVHLHGHVREHELDALERGDRLAELLPLLRVPGGRVERRLADADGHRARHRPRHVERAHRDLESLALLAEPLLDRYGAVREVERHGGRAADAHLLLFLADLDPRNALP